MLIQPHLQWTAGNINTSASHTCWLAESVRGFSRDEFFVGDAARFAQASNGRFEHAPVPLDGASDGRQESD